MSTDDPNLKRDTSNETPPEGSADPPETSGLRGQAVEELNSGTTTKALAEKKLGQGVGQDGQTILGNFDLTGPPESAPDAKPKDAPAGSPDDVKAKDTPGAKSDEPQPQAETPVDKPPTVESEKPGGEQPPKGQPGTDSEKPAADIAAPDIVPSRDVARPTQGHTFLGEALTPPAVEEAPAAEPVKATVESISAPGDNLEPAAQDADGVDEEEEELKKIEKLKSSGDFSLLESLGPAKRDKWLESASPEDRAAFEQYQIRTQAGDWTHVASMTAADRQVWEANASPEQKTAFQQYKDDIARGEYGFVDRLPPDLQDRWFEQAPKEQQDAYVDYAIDRMLSQTEPPPADATPETEEKTVAAALETTIPSQDAEDESAPAVPELKEEVKTEQQDTEIEPSTGEAPAAPTEEEDQSQDEVKSESQTKEKTEDQEKNSRQAQAAEPPEPLKDEERKQQGDLSYLSKLTPEERQEYFSNPENKVTEADYKNFEDRLNAGDLSHVDRLGAERWKATASADEVKSYEDYKDRVTNGDFSHLDRVNDENFDKFRQTATDEEWASYWNYRDRIDKGDFSFVDRVNQENRDAWVASATDQDFDKYLDYLDRTGTGDYGFVDKLNTAQKNDFLSDAKQKEAYESYQDRVANNDYSFVDGLLDKQKWLDEATPEQKQGYEKYTEAVSKGDFSFVDKMSPENRERFGEFDPALREKYNEHNRKTVGDLSHVDRLPAEEKEAFLKDPASKTAYDNYQDKVSAGDFTFVDRMTTENREQFLKDNPDLADKYKIYQERVAAGDYSHLDRINSDNYISWLDTASEADLDAYNTFTDRQLKNDFSYVDRMTPEARADFERTQSQFEKTGYENYLNRKESGDYGFVKDMTPEEQARFLENPDEKKAYENYEDRVFQGDYSFVDRLNDNNREKFLKDPNGALAYENYKDKLQAGDYSFVERLNAENQEAFLADADRKAAYESYQDRVAAGDYSFVGKLNTDNQIDFYMNSTDEQFTGLLNYEDKVKAGDFGFVDRLSPENKDAFLKDEANKTGYENYQNSIQAGDYSFVDRLNEDNQVEFFLESTDEQFDGYLNYTDRVEAGDYRFVDQLNEENRERFLADQENARGYESFKNSIGAGDYSFVDRLNEANQTDFFLNSTDEHFDGYLNYQDRLQAGDYGFVDQLDQDGFDKWFDGASDEDLQGYLDYHTAKESGDYGFVDKLNDANFDSWVDNASEDELLAYLDYKAGKPPAAAEPSTASVTPAGDPTAVLPGEGDQPVPQPIPGEAGQAIPGSPQGQIPDPAQSGGSLPGSAATSSTTPGSVEPTTATPAAGSNLRDLVLAKYGQSSGVPADPSSGLGSGTKPAPGLPAADPLKVSSSPGGDLPPPAVKPQPGENPTPAPENSPVAVTAEKKPASEELKQAVRELPRQSAPVPSPDPSKPPPAPDAGGSTPDRQTQRQSLAANVQPPPDRPVEPVKGEPSPPAGQPDRTTQRVELAQGVKEKTPQPGTPQPPARPSPGEVPTPVAPVDNTKPASPAPPVVKPAPEAESPPLEQKRQDRINTVPRETPPATPEVKTAPVTPQPPPPLDTGKDQARIDAAVKKEEVVKSTNPTTPTNPTNPNNPTNPPNTTTANPQTTNTTNTTTTTTTTTTSPNPVPPRDQPVARPNQQPQQAPVPSPQDSPGTPRPETPQATPSPANPNPAPTRQEQISQVQQRNSNSQYQQPQHQPQHQQPQHQQPQHQQPQHQQPQHQQSPVNQPSQPQGPQQPAGRQVDRPAPPEQSQGPRPQDQSGIKTGDGGQSSKPGAGEKLRHTVEGAPVTRDGESGKVGTPVGSRSGEPAPGKPVDGKVALESTGLPGDRKGAGVLETVSGSKGTDSGKPGSLDTGVVERSALPEGGVSKLEKGDGPPLSEREVALRDRIDQLNAKISATLEREDLTPDQRTHLEKQQAHLLQVRERLESRSFDPSGDSPDAMARRVEAYARFLGMSGSENVKADSGPGRFTEGGVRLRDGVNPDAILPGGKLDPRDSGRIPGGDGKTLASDGRTGPADSRTIDGRNIEGKPVEFGRLEGTAARELGIARIGDPAAIGSQGSEAIGPQGQILMRGLDGKLIDKGILSTEPGVAKVQPLNQSGAPIVHTVSTSRGEPGRVLQEKGETLSDTANTAKTQAPGIGLSQMGQNLPQGKPVAKADPQQQGPPGAAGASGVQIQPMNLPTVNITGADPNSPVIAVGSSGGQVQVGTGGIPGQPGAGANTGQAVVAGMQSQPGTVGVAGQPIPGGVVGQGGTAGIPGQPAVAGVAGLAGSPAGTALPGQQGATAVAGQQGVAGSGPQPVAAGLPGQQAVAGIPNQQGTTNLAGQQATVPGQQATVPAQQATVPGQQPTVPAQQPTVPAQQTTVPGQQATVPGQHPIAPSDDQVDDAREPHLPSQPPPAGTEEQVPGTSSGEQVQQIWTDREALDYLSQINEQIRLQKQEELDNKIDSRYEDSWSARGTGQNAASIYNNEGPVTGGVYQNDPAPRPPAQDSDPHCPPAEPAESAGTAQPEPEPLMEAPPQPGPVRPPQTTMPLPDASPYPGIPGIPSDGGTAGGAGPVLGGDIEITLPGGGIVFDSGTVTPGPSPTPLPTPHPLPGPISPDHDVPVGWDATELDRLEGKTVSNPDGTVSEGAGTQPPDNSQPGAPPTSPAHPAPPAHPPGIDSGHPPTGPIIIPYPVPVEGSGIPGKPLPPSDTFSPPGSAPPPGSGPHPPYTEPVRDTQHPQPQPAPTREPHLPPSQPHPALSADPHTTGPQSPSGHKPDPHQPVPQSHSTPTHDPLPPAHSPPPSAPAHDPHQPVTQSHWSPVQDPSPLPPSSGSLPQPQPLSQTPPEQQSGATEFDFSPGSKPEPSPQSTGPAQAPGEAFDASPSTGEQEIAIKELMDLLSQVLHGGQRTQDQLPEVRPETIDKNWSEAQEFQNTDGLDPTLPSLNPLSILNGIMAPIIDPDSLEDATVPAQNPLGIGDDFIIGQIGDNIDEIISKTLQQVEPPVDSGRVGPLDDIVSSLTGQTGQEVVDLIAGITSAHLTVTPGETISPDAIVADEMTLPTVLEQLGADVAATLRNPETGANNAIPGVIGQILSPEQLVLPPQNAGTTSEDSKLTPYSIVTGTEGAFTGLLPDQDEEDGLVSQLEHNELNVSRFVAQALLDERREKENERLQELKEKQEEERREREEKQREEEARRYAAAMLAALKARRAQEEAERIRAQKQLAAMEARQKYIVLPGDTLESIAQKKLFNRRLAVLIFEINRGKIPVKVKDGKKLLQLRPRTVLFLPTRTDIRRYQSRWFGKGYEVFEYDPECQADARTNPGLIVSASQLSGGHFASDSAAATTPMSAPSGSRSGKVVQLSEAQAKKRRRNIEAILGPIAEKPAVQNEGRIKYIVRLGDTLRSIAIRHPALKEASLWRLLAEINHLSTETDRKGVPLAELKRGSTILLPLPDEIKDYKKRHRPVTAEIQTGGRKTADQLSGEITSKPCAQCRRLVQHSASICPGCGCSFSTAFDASGGRSKSEKDSTEAACAAREYAVAFDYSGQDPPLIDTSGDVERAPASGEDHDIAPRESVSAVSEQCRIVVRDSQPDDSFTARLEFRHYDKWVPVLVYEMSDSTTWRHEYDLSGSRRTSRIDLPAPQARQLAQNDISNHWPGYLHKFLKGPRIVG